MLFNNSRVENELIHQIGSLLLISSHKPRFSQIYIYDFDFQHQAEIRLLYHHRVLDKSVVLQLQHMLQLDNSYIKAFIN